MKYYISYCAYWAPFPVQPPEEVDKIWTIRKTATTLSNLTLPHLQDLMVKSLSSQSACVSKWGGDVVEKIKFASDDTASDSYRAKLVCPGFTVDGSVQGSWNDTDIGQTVNIECQKKYVRDGSHQRTCNTDGEWNINAPLCRQLDQDLIVRKLEKYLARARTDNLCITCTLL
eukprot:sb/3472120/